MMTSDTDSSTAMRMAGPRMMRRMFILFLAFLMNAASTNSNNATVSVLSDVATVSVLDMTIASTAIPNSPIPTLFSSSPPPPPSTEVSTILEIESSPYSTVLDASIPTQTLQSTPSDISTPFLEKTTIHISTPLQVEPSSYTILPTSSSSLVQDTIVYSEPMALSTSPLLSNLATSISQTLVASQPLISPTSSSVENTDVYSQTMASFTSSSLSNFVTEVIQSHTLVASEPTDPLNSAPASTLPMSTSSLSSTPVALVSSSSESLSSATSTANAVFQSSSLPEVSTSFLTSSLSPSPTSSVVLPQSSTSQTIASSSTTSPPPSTVLLPTPSLTPTPTYPSPSPTMVTSSFPPVTTAGPNQLSILEWFGIAVGAAGVLFILFLLYHCYQVRQRNVLRQRKEMKKEILHVDFSQGRHDNRVTSWRNSMALDAMETHIQLPQEDGVDMQATDNHGFEDVFLGDETHTPAANSSTYFLPQTNL